MSFLAIFHKNYLKLSALLMIILSSCANPVAPTGGPKDDKAPEVVATTPPDKSVNFTGNEIEFRFSEFVKLKDIQNQLIISPPVKETPDLKIKGKSIVAEFKEPWRENTTYNIFFGDAIVDLTEENPIPGYKFTFSTGPVLDSMMISGKLLNAYTLTPVEKAYVMLYDTIFDSVPYKQIPYYISRTNKSGEFELTNLRNIPYKIFALSDINANYLYDLPNEDIAFIDSVVNPWIPPKSSLTFLGDSARLTDSVTLTDSVLVQMVTPDSIAIVDTLKRAPVQDSIAASNNSLMIETPSGKYFQLFHFREVDSIQTLLKSQLIRENVLAFYFRYPAVKPEFRILEGYQANPVIDNNKTNDSLTMWLPGYTADSIKLEIFSNGAVLDTVEMAVKPVGKAAKSGTENKEQFLAMKSNLPSGKIKPNATFRLNFPDPVLHYNLDSLILIEDSVRVSSARIEFTDSVKNALVVKYPWKQGIIYRLTIPDSSFTSIMGLSNDSTTFSFGVLTAEETSLLNFKIDLPENTPYIIQLLDPKEKLIAQYGIAEDATIEFPFMAAGKYKVKAIDDRNGNGYWDTGSYLKGRYPERVIYYPMELELRANWVLDQEWIIPAAGK